jgi:hypothetical protein
VTARTDPRTVRRLHQLAEITALTDGGERRRAGDLARLHLAEFPEDGELLGALALP